MLHITEDTPADMLAGSMELIIHLPSGKTVKMFAERSTPMMDMLVQITTNNHLQITNYVLQPLQTFSNPDQPEKVLTYYPNTPIGTLDTQHIRVVSKTRVLPAPKTVPPGHQPFESTFRLKVHLPRNQLYVTRVSRNVLIEDIMRKVCEEKDLDPNKYEVRHPGNLTEVLDPKLTLNDYMVTEIHLMIVNSKTQTFTSNDIINLKQDSGRKQHQPKTGGVFNLIFKKNKSNTGSGPFSAAIHSIFTTRKDNNKSHTMTPAPPVVVGNSKSDCDKTEVPRPPQRKRRPAPKPPQTVVEKIDDRPEIDSVEMRIKPEVSEKTENSETNLTICHSRHSSDSSGYHETSFLSDQCNTSLPRIGRLKDGKLSKNDRRHTSDFGNRMAITERSRSTPSLIFPGRKKKAAPSPPTFSQKPTNSPANLEKPSPVVASITSVGFFPSRTESTETNSTETIEIKEEVLDETFAAKIETEQLYSVEITPKSSIIFDEKDTEFTTNEIESCVYEKFPADSGNSSDISEKSKIDYEEVDDIEQINEQVWQLPSPPKAFKDSALNNQNEQTEMAQNNTVIVPELITKLKALEEEQERNDEKLEKTSDEICDEQPIYNKLSLEHLEKRRTLVYNRELATSLKSTCNSGQDSNSVLKKYQSDLELSGKLNEFIDMLEDIRRNNMLMNEKNRRSLTQSTLPNFKITTYDEPKQIVKVFEDDTIRSNSTVNLNRAQSLQKINYDNKSDYISNKINKETNNNNRSRKSVKRSESFSSEYNGWSSTNPVTRSKSQVGMKKRGEPATSLSKTSSLYDISGLQSLGVMKRIQNKLNSPAIPTEPSAVNNETKYRTSKADEETMSRKRFTHPASINICTWSERSKIPVNTQHDGQEPKISATNLNNCNKTEHQTLKIKINESNPKNTVTNGNIVIKIGGEEPQKSHNDSDFHVSRIPVVRSVELKKNFDDTTKRFTKSLSIEVEPNLSKNFKMSTLKNSSTDVNTNKYGKTIRSHMTLPMNSQFTQEYTTNQNVPYSTFNLRNTKNSPEKIELTKRKTLPQVGIDSRKHSPILDPRAELLRSIQEFGGKKGLKSRRT